MSNTICSNTTICSNDLIVGSSPDPEIDVSNRTFLIKEDPVLPESLRIIANFESGDEQWSEIDLSVDEGIGYIYYLNHGGSVLAYESTTGWEIEYRYLQFGDSVSIAQSEYEALLDAFEELITDHCAIGTDDIDAMYYENVAINKIYYETYLIYYKQDTDIYLKDSQNNQLLDFNNNSLLCGEVI